MPPLRPIVQYPRYRLVADQIATSLRAGELAPGAKMPTDKDLVEQLGVSRATVREAMIALELMGYVETRFGSGAFVASVLPVEPQDGAPQVPGFFELVEARFHIESRIAGLAATACTEEDLDVLRGYVAQMVATDIAFEEIEAADRAFHMALARMTGNTVFMGIVEQFWVARKAYPKWTRTHNLRSPKDRGLHLEAEHMAIVDAIAAGDAEGAERAMQQHCRNSGLPMLTTWEEMGERESPSEARVMGRVAGWQTASEAASAKS